MKLKGVHQLEGKNLRLIYSCLRQLSKLGYQVPLQIETAQEGATFINDLVQSLNNDEQGKNQFVRRLQTEAEQSLLPVEELNWLKNNERACFWVWGTISTKVFNGSPCHPCTPHSVNANKILNPNYKIMDVKKITSSSDERLQEILNFFDQAFQPLEWKLQLLEWLKTEWAKIYNTRKPFSWLSPTDSEQCDWAWSYISNTDNSFSTPNTDGILPVSQKEKYLAIYAAYDCWDAPSDSKKLFCHNFNKAWHQKKHRDSRQGKKVCNLVLREDVKRKLDQMADERRITRNRLVEILIDHEYSNKTLD